MHLYRTGSRMTDNGCKTCESMFLRSNLERLLKLDRLSGRLQVLKCGLCGVYTTSHEEYMTRRGMMSKMQKGTTRNCSVNLDFYLMTPYFHFVLVLKYYTRVLTPKE